MINFYIEQNKVRFEINLQSLRSSGLNVSSKVMHLARIIQGSIEFGSHELIPAYLFKAETNTRNYADNGHCFVFFECVAHSL